MKCIHCGSDTKYPVRSANGGRCGSCQHPFAFDPKVNTEDGVPLSDGLFERVIQDVSGEKKLAYTNRQLYYEFCRRLQRKRITQWTGRGCAAGCLSLALGVVLGLALSGVMPLALPICAALGVGAGMFIGSRVTRADRGKELPRVPITLEEFNTRYVKRWLDIHGALKQLAVSKTLPALRDSSLEPDVTSYSFDRVLVVDHADIAAMLVANRFHFETSCAILSIDGYPEGRSKDILEMLHRNPNLKVFAMHDASAPGLEVAHKLREECWFPDPGVKIYDIGLRPADAQEMKLAVIPLGSSKVTDRVRSALQPSEVAWLEAGNSVEHAALRPSRLMRAAYAGITRASSSADGYTDHGGIYFFDAGPTGVWYGGSGADLGAPDSFG